MRQLAGPLFGASAALALAACASTSAPGGQPPERPSAPSSSSNTPSLSPSSYSAPQAPALAIFPLSISRTGGIAGVSVAVVIQGDGKTTITGRGAEPRRCTIKPEVMESLTTAISVVQWDSIPPASTRATHPDELVTLVGSAAGGPARLGDPRLKDLRQTVNDLVTDLTGGNLTGGAAAYLLCIPD